MPLGPLPFPDASLKVALTTSTDSCRVWGAAWNPPTGGVGGLAPPLPGHRPGLSALYLLKPPFVTPKNSFQFSSVEIFFI